MLSDQGRYLGPGHTGVVEMPDGRYALSFHYYDGDAAGESRLSVSKLRFDVDGWPYVPEPDQPFRFPVRR